MDGGIRTDTPDWQPLLTFFLNSLQQQKAWARDRCRCKPLADYRI